jgi:hypothetical protein
VACKLFITPLEQAVNRGKMSARRPKARFSTVLPSGEFLSLSVWQGKSDPTAEVLSIQVRRREGEGWITVSRLAVYRSPDGSYSQLPDRTS